MSWIQSNFASIAKNEMEENGIWSYAIAIPTLGTTGVTINQHIAT